MRKREEATMWTDLFMDSLITYDQTNRLNPNPDIFNPKCPASALKNAIKLQLYRRGASAVGRAQGGFICTDLKASYSNDHLTHLQSQPLNLIGSYFWAIWSFALSLLAVAQDKYSTWEEWSEDNLTKGPCFAPNVLNCVFSLSGFN